MTVRHEISAFLCGWLAIAAISTDARAEKILYGITGGGLDAGQACTSATPSSGCSANSVFGVDDTYGVTGSIVHDDVAGTIDIDITLTTGSMVGNLDGVAELVFTTTTYNVAGMSAMAFGNQIFGLGARVGTVAGSYSQLDGSAVVVGGPDGFSESTAFTAFSCLLAATGNGQCGFTVGANRDFNLLAGADATPIDVRHTFNVTVAPIPEPGALLAFAVGIASVGFVRRRG